MTAGMRADIGADVAEASKAMADAHRLFHGAGGWNHCEMDPCHSVCVMVGDLGLLLAMLTEEADARS